MIHNFSPAVMRELLREARELERQGCHTAALLKRRTAAQMEDRLGRTERALAGARTAEGYSAYLLALRPAFLSLL